MVLICQFLTNQDINLALLSMIYWYLAKSLLSPWVSCLYCVDLFIFFGRWSFTDVSITLVKTSLPTRKGRKIPRGFIFPCRGEVELWHLSFWSWVHSHAAALLGPIHFQQVDYFGNKVSGRPVNGCCCIDTSRLKCFQRDKPGGKKKPNQ